MSTQPGAPLSARGRVLIVDDDQALSEMLGIVLRGEGFDPVFCGDGAQALQVFRSCKPDVVLLDLMLPGRDGIDVCRSIRAESGVPIVMLTAKTDTIGDLAIDVSGHQVTRDGQALSLTPLEFDLLVCLARRPGKVFTREILLQEVWGYRHAADTRLVNVHVQRLRAKIEHDPEDPTIVVTVRGVGYKAGSA
jgi:two-component system response regulator MtrA